MLRSNELHGGMYVCMHVHKWGCKHFIHLPYICCVHFSSHSWLESCLAPKHGWLNRILVKRLRSMDIFTYICMSVCVREHAVVIFGLWKQQECCWWKPAAWSSKTARMQQAAIERQTPHAPFPLSLLCMELVENRWHFVTRLTPWC